jgi:hypothetical protein
MDLEHDRTKFSTDWKEAVMSDDIGPAEAYWEREIAFGSLFVGSLLVPVSLAALGFGI